MVVMVVTALSCSEEQDSLPPIRYETDEAIVGTAFEDRLCGGDLLHIDERLQYLEDILGARSDEPVEVYLYREKPPQCKVFGCFVDDRYVATQWTSLDHELVHAVVSRIGRPRLFWSEGNAVAFSGRRSEAGMANIAEQVNVTDDGSLDYPTAGHFVRWLVEERGGPSQIRRVVVGEPFSDVYGTSVEEAASEHVQEAPWSYPPLFPCSAPQLAGTEGQWEETVAVDCESSDALSRTSTCATVARVLRVSEPGTHELAATGGNVRLVGCQVDALEVEPGTQDGDIPFQYESALPVFVAFEPNVAHVLRMDAGLYEMTVESCELEEPSSVTVRLTRTSG